MLRNLSRELEKINLLIVKGLFAPKDHVHHNARRILVDRPTARIVEGLEALAEMTHPEVRGGGRDEIADGPGDGFLCWKKSDRSLAVSDL